MSFRLGCQLGNDVLVLHTGCVHSHIRNNNNNNNKRVEQYQNTHFKGYKLLKKTKHSNVIKKQHSRIQMVVAVHLYGHFSTVKIECSKFTPFIEIFLRTTGYRVTGNTMLFRDLL